MKRLISTSVFFFVLFVDLMLLPWNVNLASSGCNGFSHKAFCNYPFTIVPNRISEKPVQQVAPGVFPFGDLIIKI